MAKAKISQEADTISTLPDQVLSHIISFLPLKEAIRTSTLSSRWRKIFTLIPNLNFHDDFKRSVPENYKFMNFVSRNLFFHAGTVDKICITCGEPVDPYRVNGWIRYALLSQVRELDLSLDSQIPNKLPIGIFTCKTLEVLRLTIDARRLQLPAKICLPTLKCLHLCGMKLSCVDLIQRLICSCSVLEELVIERCQLEKACKFNVFNPAMKRLTISYVVGVDQDDYEIRIDAPSLVYFKCIGFLPKRFLPKNLNSLVQVRLHFRRIFHSYRSFLFCNAATIDLFKGISNVQSLHLSGTLAKGETEHYHVSLSRSSGF